MQKTKTGIIGAGKLGLSLAEAFERYNLLNLIVVKSKLKIQPHLKTLNKKIIVYSSIEDIEILPEVLFLTVSDSSIETVSEKLAKHFGKKLKDKIIVHCSGSLDVDILDKCKLQGAYTISAHPYQTFSYSSKNLLKGISWGIETEAKIDVIYNLIKLTGGNPVKIEFKNHEEKALYHCSAVIASNFMTALIDFSKFLITKLGLETEKFISPIVKTTLENNFTNMDETKKIPLTGPIARGDIETIKEHLKALELDSYSLKSYCYFALGTLESAYHYNLVDDLTYKGISDLLNEILINKKKFISYH